VAGAWDRVDQGMVPVGKGRDLHWVAVVELAVPVVERAEVREAPAGAAARVCGMPARLVAVAAPVLDPADMGGEAARAPVAVEDPAAEDSAVAEVSVEAGAGLAQVPAVAVEDPAAEDSEAAEVSVEAGESVALMAVQEEAALVPEQLGVEAVV
jgi:hypothetical protein